MPNQPHDPFGENPNSPAYTAAGQANGGPAPKKSKSPLFWVIGCLGVMGLMGIVCCGGIVGMTYFGMTQVASQFQSQIEDHPVIIEHIGEIDSMSMSWADTMANAQNQGGGANELAFQISGTKGSGTLFIVNDNTGEGAVPQARLVTADGQSYEVEIGSQGAEDSDAGGLDLESTQGEGLDATEAIDSLSPAE